MSMRCGDCEYFYDEKDMCSKHPDIKEIGRLTTINYYCDNEFVYDFEELEPGYPYSYKR